MSDGVLLTGFGGPASLDEVAAFCTNLMGREPSPEVLERVSRRYLTIGGASPLPGIAREIADKLRDRLSKDGKPAPVETGMLYSPPFIADALGSLVEAGVDRVVTVSLSPFESSHSSGAYRQAVAKAAALFPGVTIAEAPSFRTRQPFLEQLAQGAGEALEDSEGSQKAIVFTAHSLPLDEIGDDPYVEQLRETANGVAVLLGLDAAPTDAMQSWLPGVKAFGSFGSRVPWLLAYQSKGQRQAKWLEPDVLDVVRALASAGFDAVIFAPIGFATDHLETLYDLDVEACGLALDLGMDFQRAAVPNESEGMIGALAGVLEPLL